MRTRLPALSAAGVVSALLLAGCTGSSAAGPVSTSGSSPTAPSAVPTTTAIGGGDRLDRSTEQADLAVVQGLFAAGAPGLAAGMKAVIARTAADGPYVAVHWHESSDPAQPWTGRARLDLFKLANGAVTEHWSLAQDVPTSGASGHTMFDDAYRGPRQTLSQEQQEAQRQFVVAAYDTLFRDHDTSVLDRSFDPGYRQHNPAVPDGTAPLKQFFAGASFPAQESALSLSDGDLVWTFSRPVAGPAEAFTAGDVFRVAGGRIVEHWDVVPTAAVSPTTS